MKVSFPTTKLSDFIEPVKEKYKDNPNEFSGVDVYGVTNKDGVIITGKEASVDLSNYTIVRDKCFVYNPYRVNVGSLGLSPKNFLGAVSPAYVVFKTKEGLLDDEFLLEYLKSPLGINLIKWYGDRGGVRSALRFNDLKRIDIPDLNLDKQKLFIKKYRSVGVLKERLNGVQNSLLNNVSFLRGSILREAFQGGLVNQDENDVSAREFLKELKNKRGKLLEIQHSKVPYQLPNGWAWCKIRDITELQNGYAFKSSLFAKEGVSLVRNINITHGEINWEKCVCYPKSEIKGLDRFSLQENDILISLDRPIISTGLKIAVVTKKDLPCMLVQRVCRINSKKLDVNFKYLFFWFLSQNFIESIDPGRSKGVPHLATRDIEKLFFPLPPMKEQERIVKKVETLMQFCDVLVERVQQSEIHAGQLMQAILQEAFSSDEQEKEVKLSVTQTNENFWFNLKLGIGAVLEGLRSSPYQRGEMVIAKMLYFLQEIYKVSFGLNFVKQKFGPYDAKVKRVIQSDLKKDKAFRVMQVKGKQVYDLGSNSDRLLKYNSDTLTNSRASMEDLLMRIGKLGSDKIELIASICKVIQDEKVIEEQDIYEKLSEWKPEKYTIADVKDAMRKIKYWEWDKKLDS